MKKETFVMLMNGLEKSKTNTSEMVNEITQTLKKYRPDQMDFISDAGVIFEDWSLTDSVVEAVAKDFNYSSAEDDITWWVYESEFGKKYGYIYYNDKKIDVSNAELLYDALMFLEEEEKRNKKAPESPSPTTTDRYPNHTLKSLFDEINEAINHKPAEWRRGQFVFNYIDEKYGIAREVQFKHGIDCFYDDNNIDKFLNCAATLLNKRDKQTNI